MNSTEDNGAGSSNVLQDSNDVHGSEPGADQEPINESFNSTQTTAESIPASASISVCSESSLFVPSKLFTDISKLKSCYSAILKDISIAKTNKNVVNEQISDDRILLMTCEQIETCCNRNTFSGKKAKTL